MHAVAALGALLVLGAAGAAAEEISGARYESPVERYGHFALGRPHEYARVVATTDAGRQVALELPEDEVFEDLAPRNVRLARGAPADLLAIVSSRTGGSRLALLGLAGGRLAIVAQSPPIGTPSRWLNPVGAADLDGDGVAEIAAVTTPHIGGVLRVYRREGARLREVASLPGFSNHVYGTSELRLSAVVASGGRARLLVPDATRRQLRLIALEGGKLVEERRCALPAPLTGPVDPSACAATAAGAAPSAVPVMRCGWFENPSPANVTFTDRDGEWLIGMQGGHQADGDWPRFRKGEWVATNRSYGHGCACLKVIADPGTREVRQIVSAKARPLKSCRGDKALKEPEG